MASNGRIHGRLAVFQIAADGRGDVGTAKVGPAARPAMATTLEDMVMRATPAIGQEHPRLRAIVREGLTALRNAWTAYMLKRAIADVASMREQDYREFGLDKAEILAELVRLRDKLEGNGAPATGPAHREESTHLAIVVTKRRRASFVGLAK